MSDKEVQEKSKFDLKAELKSIGMTQKDFAKHIDTYKKAKIIVGNGLLFVPTSSIN